MDIIGIKDKINGRVNFKGWISPVFILYIIYIGFFYMILFRAKR